MAEVAGSNGMDGVVSLTVKDTSHNPKSDERQADSFLTLPFMQKVTCTYIY